MGFERMRQMLFAGSMLLALAACGSEEAKAPATDGGGPQIATSIDDYAVPVDKSDQITAIDAATGDTGGMPRDGGAVVRTAKPETREEAGPAGDNVAAPAPPPPLVVPPPVTSPTPASAAGE
jgi:hypothetical protein